MKVMVSGATGFVGKHLCKRLLHLRHEVYGTYRKLGQYTTLERMGVEGFECNLANENEVKLLFKRVNPDVIFHLAANPNPKLDSKNPNGIIHDNVIATHNLLNFCPIVKFINTSSVLVYGNYDDYRTEEDMCSPTSLYGMTKIASEDLVNIYHTYRDIQGINLRLSAVVGTGVTHGLLYDLIRKAKTQDHLDLIGNEPGTCKPFLHVDDAVDVYIKCLDYDTCGTFNICNRIPITVKEVADIVLKTIGKDMPITWSGQLWKGDNEIIKCENSLASVMLGWSPTYNSSEAIEKVVKCQL